MEEGVVDHRRFCRRHSSTFIPPSTISPAIWKFPSFCQRLILQAQFQDPAAGYGNFTRGTANAIIRLDLDIFASILAYD